MSQDRVSLGSYMKETTSATRWDEFFRVALIFFLMSLLQTTGSRLDIIGRVALALATGLAGPSFIFGMSYLKNRRGDRAEIIVLAVLLAIALGIVGYGVLKRLNAIP